MDAVVKIDSELLEGIEKLIKKNKYQYSSKKQVVNLAISEFLSSFSWEEKNSLKNKKVKTAGIFIKREVER